MEDQHDLGSEWNIFGDEHDEFNHALLESYAAGFAQALATFDIDTDAPADVQSLMDNPNIARLHYSYWKNRSDTHPPADVPEVLTSLSTPPQEEPPRDPAANASRLIQSLHDQLDMITDPGVVLEDPDVHDMHQLVSELAHCIQHMQHQHALREDSS